MYRNDRTERAKLYNHWIIEQDKPCAKCGSRESREIAHIIPYHLGGETTEVNCRVLCRACNLAERHASKFSIGDQVVLNGRTPESIDGARHRPRTIIDIEYSRERQCNYYRLGYNGGDHRTQPLCEWDYPFRSYMLHYPRSYHYKRQYVRKANGINLRGKGGDAIAEYQPEHSKGNRASHS